MRIESAGSIACAAYIYCKLSADDPRNIVTYPFGCTLVTRAGGDTCQSIAPYFMKYHILLGKVLYDTFFVSLNFLLWLFGNAIRDAEAYC